MKSDSLAVGQHVFCRHAPHHALSCISCPHFNAGSVLDVHLRKSVPVLVYLTAAGYALMLGAAIYGAYLHSKYGPSTRRIDSTECWRFGRGVRMNAEYFSLNAVISHWVTLGSKFTPSYFSADIIPLTQLRTLTMPHFVMVRYLQSSC